MAGRMLVTGATGVLGSRVAHRAAGAGWSVVGTYFTQPSGLAGEPLDIRDRLAVHRLVERIGPDVVVHAAVGRDANDWAANADGAAHVAVASSGARLIHVSSDAVFSGRAVDYDEAALPDPVNPYGAAKAAAETAVRAVVPDAVIVRTSLILGDARAGHELLTHELAGGRRSGALFTDEIRKPVHVDDLADALLELAVGSFRGVLNVAGADPISRYDLGLLVARRDGLDARSLPAGRSAELGLSRPTDVRLRLDLARSLLRTRLRGAHEFTTVDRSGPSTPRPARGSGAPPSPPSSPGTSSR